MPRKQSPNIGLSKFQHPYNAAGRTNFAYTQGRSGVYVIQKNGRTVYIGYSETNLYKTMYRHFQDWRHKRQVVVTYYGQDRSQFKCRVILCEGARAKELEKALIIKHKPKDNPDKLRGYVLSKAENDVYDVYQKAPVYSNKALEEAPF